MRLVIARCTVDYDGRLTAHLPEAIRLLMVKADGCVSIHADGGAYKPLNWMTAPNTLTDEEGCWVVRNPKGEVLTITLLEVLSDTEHTLGDDPGLQKDGVEAHLQELLAADPAFIADDLRLVRREFPTAIGPVDLLCRDGDGVAVAIEVKRRGEIDGVEQLTRYLDFLNRDPMLRPVRGMLVAQEVRLQARVLADDRNIEWLEVNYDDLRGIESNELKLF
ncbi:MAG: endonuclease [Acidimicrobiaceae bacterium]|nr:endonuclease [Acidimicrobiaceae bacterium]HJO79179.1 endonuclease NucS [Acidimicrobiales bacterium]